MLDARQAGRIVAPVAVVALDEVAHEVAVAPPRHLVDGPARPRGGPRGLGVDDDQRRQPPARGARHHLVERRPVVDRGRGVRRFDDPPKRLEPHPADSGAGQRPVPQRLEVALVRLHPEEPAERRRRGRRRRRRGRGRRRRRGGGRPGRGRGAERDGRGGGGGGDGGRRGRRAQRDGRRGGGR
ncbi:hypothetical protein DCC79_16210, partial [bacterium]